LTHRSSRGTVTPPTCYQVLRPRAAWKIEDIATATLFFVSEQANWITGQVLSVDGGRS
jgi:3-oxoacyl-[acyl-carrier protein] reductase